jgi:tetratricopeptide (TPR) repeat protein
MNDKTIDSNNCVEGNVSGGNVAGENITIQNQEIHHHYPQPESKIAILDSTPEVNLSHLPTPSTPLIGRKTELAQLTQAFENPKNRLATIIAPGGIGKSALTDAWLKQVAPDYHGMQRVFAWSFYSQGQHQTYTNSSAFFQAVLPFLGIKEIPQTEVDKARSLANCLQNQAVLLILDGIEPLQQAPHLGGFLQDGGIKELLAQLRRGNRSFVLLSSRQAVQELEDWEEDVSFSLPLETLKDDEGALLLAKLKVTGSEAERQKLSDTLGGHALSLVLCGHLLWQFHRGDITYSKELPPLSTDAKDGGQARRVLQYYDSLLSENERWFMYALGLFDRPMDWREKLALFSGEDLPGFKNLEGLGDKIEQSLEEKGLLLPQSGLEVLQGLPVLARTQWDTHPLIREFFAAQFQQQQPAAFKAAHALLFAYFQKLPEKQQPDTLAELAPLYRAVLHGCLAGEYQKALDDVYWSRIDRSSEGYGTNKLGAYNEALSAIAAFFPQGWTQMVDSGLSEPAQAFLLSEASYCLMSLGRLAEAVAPYEASVKLYEKLENWGNAAYSGRNLVDLYLPLGELSKAETAARMTINYAQRTDDKYIQMDSHSKLAMVLHRLGKLTEAHAAFIETENLQQQFQPHYPLLYSLPGAQYCALLLDLAKNADEIRSVLQRAEFLTTSFAHENRLLDSALGYLSLARCHVALNNFPASDSAFQQAVSGIQKAGSVMDMPEFYLSRADFYLCQTNLTAARADLNSAWDIINRSGMKLYATDACLSEARYHLALNQPEIAKQFCERAQMLISETGYHLRDKNLAELRTRLHG